MKRNNITILALCLSITSCSMFENVTIISTDEKIEQSEGRVSESTSIVDSNSSLISESSSSSIKESKSESENISSTTIIESDSSSATIEEINESKEDEETNPLLSVSTCNENLEISFDGKTYSNSGIKQYFAPLLNDVTSNDGVSFYIATLDPTGSKISSFTQTTFANVDYLETDVYFRTCKEGEIFLSKDSMAIPCDLTANKSAFGDFSRDYIVGAIRISIQVTGYQDSFSTTYSDASNNVEEVGKIIEPDNIKYNKNDSPIAYQVNKINLSRDSKIGQWTVNPNDTNKQAEKMYKIDDVSKGTFSKELVEIEGFSNEQKIVEISSSSPLHPYTKDNIEHSHD